MIFNIIFFIFGIINGLFLRDILDELPNKWARLKYRMRKKRKVQTVIFAKMTPQRPDTCSHKTVTLNRETAEQRCNACGTIIVKSIKTKDIK